MITVRDAVISDLDDEFREKSDSCTVFAIQGWSFAILEDGIVVALVGCVEFWDGVGQVWALVKDNIKNGFGVTKAAKELLERTMEECGYHRIQTFVDMSYKNRKWARLCGFECEARLERLAPDGSDYWIYKLIRGL